MTRDFMNEKNLLYFDVKSWLKNHNQHHLSSSKVKDSKIINKANKTSSIISSTSITSNSIKRNKSASILNKENLRKSNIMNKTNKIHCDSRGQLANLCNNFSNINNHCNKNIEFSNHPEYNERELNKMKINNLLEKRLYRKMGLKEEEEANNKTKENTNNANYCTFSPSQATQTKRLKSPPFSHSKSKEKKTKTRPLSKREKYELAYNERNSKHPKLHEDYGKIPD